jgi:hypothetical protein
MSTEDLLKLPWDLQIPLASGYAAYVLAYTGLRDRQKTVDVAFISLVFSLIATFVLAIASKHNVEPIKASAMAFGATVVSGVLWRKLGRPFVSWFLRAANITWSNDDPSALASLSGSTKYYVTQVAVYLDDGSCMSCVNAAHFNKSPFGPLQIGPNGDIALYVTEVSPADGDSREQTNVRHPEYGDRITYIPAARIRQITVRHLEQHHRPLTARFKKFFGKSSRVSRAGEACSDQSRPGQEGPLAAP